jgi:hypothetical protein
LGHEAVEAVEATDTYIGLMPALRKLLGLHEHAYGPWRPHWATPAAEGRMIRLLTRNCAHCERFEFMRETVDIPAEGFPYELHLHMRIRDKRE